jgi:GTP-binding protein
VVDLALEVVAERKKRIPTSALNKMLREAVANHPPSSKSGKAIKFFYGTQVDIEPPTFVFFCTDPKAIHFSYRRYIENQLRDRFSFIGTPIRISFRGREDAEL